MSRERVRLAPGTESGSASVREPLSAFVFRPAPSSVDGGARWRLGSCPARGVYVVLHGLHYAGPDDPRMDRFCRVLAAAGHVVVAPLLPRSLELLAHEDTTTHAQRAVAYAQEVARSEGLPPPALFTISFGSLPGIRVAARHARDELSSLVVFGGYGRFLPTLRFALGGPAEPMGHERPAAVDRDPLNGPAVFINLLPYLAREEGATFRADVLRDAWLTVARRTWGRTEMRTPATRRVVVEDVAREFGLRPADELPLFLAACGYGDTSDYQAVALRHAAGPASAFTDPRESLNSMQIPTFILHGRGDDVIPVGEAEALRSMLPKGHPVAVLVSGMHGHTGAHLPRPAELWAELRTSLHVATVLARAAVEPEAALAAIGGP